MPPPLLLLRLLLVASVAVAASADAPAPPTEGPISFRPSVAIVIGIFAIMFSLTFLLLVYAKFCHGGGRDGDHLFLRYAGGPGDDVFMSPGGAPAPSGGVDRAVVESLPSFRFSVLRGKRGGLECAVCLSKFDDADVLRLLPKCKHAFHVGCVDRWLESRSTCPLCRCRIGPDDAAALKCSSSSSRLSFRDGGSGRANGVDPDDVGNGGGGGILEVFVEREPDADELLPNHDVVLLHRHKHRIIVSGAAFKSRWSDLNSSDLLSLDSEMLLSMVSNKQFPGSKEGLGKKRLLENMSTDHLVVTTGNRCMSAMTSVSRFRSSGTDDDDDDKVRRVWLPIAQRTVQLFAGGERRPGYGENRNDVTITIA
ncbi:E3 ubiquitin-protein ligase ATL42 [Iris pallida]|uniref:RING-type E3 ubiquitin transferase n=1 Tax=Iris pallida TaxID=29817 RepID=A0AAX6GIF7_IRIPA|nr:E3 ubiquitin-protein ligase ATL42 [Iris pallida]